MPFELPPLPYDKSALEPYITAETLNFHYDKHHKTYVDTLNKLVEGTDLQDKSLNEVIKITYKDDARKKIFNNAAQVWNHTFYWHCMKQNGGGHPSGGLLSRIEKDFGSFDAFKKEFKEAAVAQFGSGWAWLVEDQGTLKVVKTSNADLPWTQSQKALLTCDVWEHAYYLDYQNKRADYVETFLNHLVNWGWVEEKLQSVSE
ncbi:MAG: superoxide dismutase [Janthinobacterium lividum]